MPLLGRIQRWIAEPAPEQLFELSENYVASAATLDPGPSKLEMLAERSLNPSPSAPNVLRPQLYRDALDRIVTGALRPRNTAALVIPDYAVRMAILDFEEFPAGEEERMALLRFRLRKSVPFHIEEAKVTYSIQLQAARRIEVLTVAIAHPILNEYELLLTDAGFRVGLVMPSCLAALPLYVKAETGLSLVAKMAGTTVSVLLLQGGRVRLARCLDLAAGEEEAPQQNEAGVLDLLQQTVAYAEDQIGEGVKRLSLCGFGEQTELMGRLANNEFDVPYEVTRSRFGTATQANAGLFGLLERYAA